ncbi:MAG TPA: hypothetical protein VGF82_15795 [Terracidiphilus sp.]
MRKVFALALLAVPLAIAGCGNHENRYYGGAPAYTEIAQRGFHDGFDAARHDMGRGWAPDVDRHGAFRNPPVSRGAFEDYRHGFREGYERAFGGRRDRY